MVKSVVVVVAALLACSAPAWAAELWATTDYNYGMGASAQDGGSSSVLPSLTASIAHPSGKVSGAARATYGTLGALARMNPDNGVDLDANGYASFLDTITINGGNLGATGTFTFRFLVTGSVQQPLDVPHAQGYADANLYIQASSDTDYAQADRTYGIQTVGTAPYVTVVNDLLEVTIDAVVGQQVEIFAELNTNAISLGLTVPGGSIDFAADIYNTVVLQPIIVEGVVNPVLTSGSGTEYPLASVPEPCLGMVVMLGLVPFRRRALLRCGSSACSLLLPFQVRVNAG